jgi:hypothetical protein
MGKKIMTTRGKIVNQVKPEILAEGQYTQGDLTSLKDRPIWKVHDIYTAQLEELFEILHPAVINTPEYSEKLSSFISERSKPSVDLRGDYIYYPWSGLLLHMVPEVDLHTLRTNRTKNLISEDEQHTMGEFTAGIAGLSFGIGIALSLVYNGASNSIKIADRDIFATSNLNRVRVGLPSVDQAKTEVTAHEIYEINPHAEVIVFNDGLTEENLDDFVNGSHNLNIIFDVVDDFSMKVRLRLAAKKAKIPVIMLTSLEDSILVDVERYDLDPEAEIFHGLLGDVTDELLTKDMSEQDKVKYAMAIVGPEHISFRNLSSLSDIGTKLVSRPHLYGTVSIVCGLAAYILKRIALGEDMPSLRKHLPFNEVLGILPAKDDTPEARAEIFAKLMKGPQR